MPRPLFYPNLFPTAAGAEQGTELAERYVADFRITAFKEENGEYRLEASMLSENGEYQAAEGWMIVQLCKEESSWRYLHGRLGMPAWPGTWEVLGRKLSSTDGKSHYLSLMLLGVGRAEIGQRKKQIFHRSGEAPVFLEEQSSLDKQSGTGAPLVSPTDNPIKVMLARLVDAIGYASITGDWDDVLRMESKARKLLETLDSELRENCSPLTPPV